jgi:hypothetical protein
MSGEQLKIVPIGAVLGGFACLQEQADHCEYPGPRPGNF